MALDYPRAWEISRSVKPEYHHNECSFNQSKGGILCDCDIIYKHEEFLDNEKLYTKKGTQDDR